MKQTNLIWDADGTLIDSYDSIIFQIEQSLDRFNLKYDKEFIREYIIKTSCSDFYHYVANKNNVSYESLWDYHNNGAKVDLSLIKLMPGVLKVLENSFEKEIKNYIYTHRGVSIKQIVKKLDIEKYFVEIVNMECGFKRKPDGEAIEYLVNKYHLDKNNTYYVGDRLLDQQCARAAGVKALFFHSNKNLILDEKQYDYKIEELEELFNII